MQRALTSAKRDATKITKTLATKNTKVTKENPENLREPRDTNALKLFCDKEAR